MTPNQKKNIVLATLATGGPALVLTLVIALTTASTPLVLLAALAITVAGVASFQTGIRMAVGR